jgi:menaquinone-9 beta-reductase
MRCDVLIVGGGPAGSTCARQLVRAGLDVVVLDRSDFPREKLCAGWITPQIVTSLQLDLTDYGRHWCLQPLDGFTCGLMKGESVSVRYPQPVSYAIRRCEFDHFLLQRCGAQLRLNEALDSVERNADGWLVNKTIQTRLLIGAGGHFCPVARLLGATIGSREPAIYAQEVEFKMSAEQAATCSVDPRQAELYFCDDLSGYAWCVRKGDYLNVGLGREDNNGLGTLLRHFWSSLAQRHTLPQDLPLRFKGHAYLLYNQSHRDIVMDQCLLVGDAAGLASPHSGEGIRPAVESALLAAQVIGDAQGDYSTSSLQRYEGQLHERFGARPRAHAASTGWLAPVRQSIGRQALRHEWFARHVLLDRFFLHRKTPALNAVHPGVIHDAFGSHRYG